MTQAKHTPGPWRYRYWSNCSDKNLLEGYSISADGHIVPMNTAEGDLYEAEANARLISAAPDFLESHEPEREGADFLDWIADRIVNVYGESENVDFVICLRRRAAKARAAIAKATGA